VNLLASLLVLKVPWCVDLMHACMYACMYAFMCACLHVCLCLFCRFVCRHLSVFCLSPCTRVYGFMSGFMYARTYVLYLSYFIPQDGKEAGLRLVRTAFHPAMLPPSPCLPSSPLYLSVQNNRISFSRAHALVVSGR